MQWDASTTGGFTQGEPWLPLVDPAQRNVADQSPDPGSLLNHYRRLLAVRQSSTALRRGALGLVADLPRDLLAWIRTSGAERVLVLANMGEASTTVDLSGIGSHADVMAASGSRQGSLLLGNLQLDPLEGLLLRL